MTPHEIANLGFARETGTSLVASGTPSGTCRTGKSARELDYFFISDAMATGIEGVRAISGTGIRTHLPVEVAFRPRLTSMRAVNIRRPPPITTERIVGPVRQVVDWTEMEAQAKNLAADAPNEEYTIEDLHARLGALFSKWADCAEQELAECAFGGQSLPKYGLRGKAPTMVWRSVLPERPKVSDKDDDQLTRWRSMANSALEMMRLTMDARRATSNQSAAHDGRMDHDGGDVTTDQDRDDEELMDEPIGYERGTLADQINHAYEEARELQGGGDVRRRARGCGRCKRGHYGHGDAAPRGHAFEAGDRPEPWGGTCQGHR